jgi:hypothetical protein
MMRQFPSLGGLRNEVGVGIGSLLTESAFAPFKRSIPVTPPVLNMSELAAELAQEVDAEKNIDSLLADAEVAKTMEISQSTKLGSKVKMDPIFHNLYDEHYPKIGAESERRRNVSSPDTKFMDSLVPEKTKKEVLTVGEKWNEGGSSSSSGRGSASASDNTSPMTGSGPSKSTTQIKTTPKAVGAFTFAHIVAAGGDVSKRYDYVSLEKQTPVKPKSKPEKSASTALKQKDKDGLAEQANGKPLHQPKKQVYGRFKCANAKCGAKWGSKKCSPNRPQICQICKTPTFPFQQVIYAYLYPYWTVGTYFLCICIDSRCNHTSFAGVGIWVP